MSITSNLSIENRLKDYENTIENGNGKVVPKKIVNLILRKDLSLKDPNKVYVSEKTLQKFYPQWTKSLGRRFK